MTTNIGYWEQILRDPTPSYKKLFEAENQYLTAHISSNSLVLDVGCGDGTTIQTILPITKRIVGIDNDAKAVEDARSRLSSVPDIKILLVDALKLPFDNQEFDVVIHMMTLVNFEINKVKVLQEMSRVLKDDGKIIISVYSELAFPARLEIYKKLDIPIEKIEGTKVTFDKSVGANESEQFTQKELELLAEQASLKIRACQKVGDLAYICELAK